jgi:hypothetical protein
MKPVILLYGTRLVFVSTNLQPNQRNRHAEFISASEPRIVNI